MHVGQPVYYLARFSYVHISITRPWLLDARATAIFAIAEIVNQNAKQDG